MTAKNRPLLRRISIFLGSPSDLDKDRTAFRDAIEEVNDILAKSRGVLFEVAGWESLPAGEGRPQAMINEELLLQSDLVFMLLWQRWGSRTGVGNEGYSSGFEEEYETAREKQKPIAFYFRKIPADARQEPDNQLRSVLSFREKISSEKRYLYREYVDAEDLKTLVLRHLSAWLDDQAPDATGRSQPKKHTSEEYLVTNRKDGTGLRFGPDLADGEFVDGRAWRFVTDRRGWAVFGPNRPRPLTPGNYRAVFHMKVQDIRPGNPPVVFIDVAAALAEGVPGQKTLGLRALTSFDFKEPDVYQDFAVLFNVVSIETQLEFRVFSLGGVDTVTLDSVRLESVLS